MNDTISSERCQRLNNRKRKVAETEVAETLLLISESTETSNELAALNKNGEDTYDGSQEETLYTQENMEVTEHITNSKLEMPHIVNVYKNIHHIKTEASETNYETLTLKNGTIDTKIIYEQYQNDEKIYDSYSKTSAAFIGIKQETEQIKFIKIEPVEPASIDDDLVTNVSCIEATLQKDSIAEIKCVKTATESVDEEHTNIKLTKNGSCNVRYIKTEAADDKYVLEEGVNCCDQQFIKTEIGSDTAGHSMKTTYSCSNTSFNNITNLRHDKLIDSGTKPYVCDYCGQYFHLVTTLNEHKIKHESFTHKGDYSCSECGKCFSKRWHLKDHRMIHYGVKPFKCSECGKRFIQNSNMKTHRLKKHSIPK